VSNSTPVRRRAAFVFGPPVIAAAVGVVLLTQGAAGSNFEILEQRRQERIESGWVVPTPEFTDYLYTNFLTTVASSDMVIVNKHNALDPVDYAPTVREVESSAALDNSRGLTLRPIAASALEEMAQDMHDAGAGVMFVNSAYRSYDYQAELFVQKTEQYGLEEALVRSAKPGHSEHQTGLAVDVSVPAQGCAIMQCFGDTEAGQWIAENAWRFGFVVRYELDTVATTGYTYEPWHLRFVGKAVTEMYHEKGIHTLEEFWGYPAAPSYPEIASSTTD